MVDSFSNFLQASQAAEIIQRQLNIALQQHGITLPPQLLQFNHAPTTTQVDGAADFSDTFEPSSSSKLENRSVRPKSTVHKKNSTKLTATNARDGKDELSGITIEADRSALDKILLDRLAKTQVCFSNYYISNQLLVNLTCSPFVLYISV